MKFTSFNPLIVTADAAPIVALFEALGFEKRHTNPNENTGVTNVTLRHPDGFQVDVASGPGMQQDLTLIRLNVDDFDEAYAFFTERGFVAPVGHAEELPTSKSIMLVSPTGFGFNLCQHIKK